MKRTLEERITKVEKELIAPMQKIDRNNLDHTLIHDVALVIENTENLIMPSVHSFQRKYKKGTYNSTLALLQMYHVAKAGWQVYKNKFFGKNSAIQFNKFHLIAVAEELLEGIENSNSHKG